MYIFTKGCIVQKAIKVPLECSIHNIFFFSFWNEFGEMCVEEYFFLKKHRTRSFFYFISQCSIRPFVLYVLYVLLSLIWQKCDVLLVHQVHRITKANPFSLAAPPSGPQ